MGIILLFGVNIMKANQIINLCKELNHNAKIVPKSDYAKPLGALAGITGKKGGAVYSGGDFANEMMVFAGISSEELDEFLAVYKKEGIAPIVRKAVITQSNAAWSALKLYRELDEHMR